MKITLGLPPLSLHTLIYSWLIFEWQTSLPFLAPKKLGPDIVSLLCIARSGFPILNLDFLILYSRVRLGNFTFLYVCINPCYQDQAAV